MFNAKRALAAAAVSLVVVAATHEPVEAQADPVDRFVEWVAWAFGAEAAYWLGGSDHGSWEASPQWNACYECQYAADSWWWRQAADDRAHEAFIDYIWDREPRDGYAHDSYGYGGYDRYGYSGYSGYGYDSYGYGGYDSYGYGGYGGHSQYGHQGYWDPMQSWYRTQRSNDRAHRAFIDYIRH